MRVANWRIPEAFRGIMDDAIDAGKEIMDEVVMAAKSRCPVGHITGKVVLLRRMFGLLLPGDRIKESWLIFSRTNDGTEEVLGTFAGLSAE